MRRLTITFSDQEAEELLELSRHERRRPHDQAAVLIAEGLQSRRALTVPRKAERDPLAAEPSEGEEALDAVA